MSAHPSRCSPNTTARPTTTSCSPVRIMLRELPTARINFFYEIYNEKGELLNTGMTQLGFIHSDTRRPCRVPDWFLKLVADKWTEE